MSEITLALSKGRILEQAVPLLGRAGIQLAEDPAESRRLIIGTNRPDLRILVVRATDAPTYVQFGAADLGIAGKDVLMESEIDELYELADLGIARCRLVVANPAGGDGWRRTPGARLRVATKYPRVAAAYFAGHGLQAEIIKLYGSMELAPLTGLADHIVDLVDTGRTLVENGLIEGETVADISARLIANKASTRLKRHAMNELISAIRSAVRDS